MKDGDEELIIDELTVENPILKGVRVNMPMIQHFDEEINKLFVIKTKVENFKATRNIFWLKVQAGPLKETLSKIVQVWISKWTNFI